MKPGAIEMIRPIAKTSLYEQIMEQIKALIVDEQLKPGDRLPSERDLADRLSASRHSVREALRVLGTMGMLEIRPGSGTFVSRQANVMLDDTVFASIVKRDFRFSVLEARKIIEPGIAALAASRATNQDLATIELHVRTMEEQVQQGVDYAEADLGFHLSLANATQNLVLIKMVNALENLLVVIPPIKEKAARSHRKILTAIKNREGEAAFHAMEEHLLGIEHEVLARIDGNPATERARHIDHSRAERSGDEVKP